MRTPASVLLLVLIWGLPANARRNGIAAEDCSGCHSGGPVPTVTLSANPASFSPGDQVVLTVGITTPSGGVGGLYLRSNGPGAFSLRSGQSTRLLSEDDVVHSAPKAAVSGAVTFQVNWTAPSQPGGVAFDVYAVAGNGNDASSGDNAASATLQAVYGCTGQTYYRDFDADGVGSSLSGTLKECSLPPGYSEVDGDCNDSHELMYPGAAEICNGRDDDCDGEIDEGLDPRTFYRDADGDGYGAASGGTKLACTAPAGYSAEDTDCDDATAFVSPGAMEQCNGRDDDCDGEVDETSGQVSCGIGACMRISSSCGGCLPGPRAKELCNGVDDDCDGLVDDDAEGCEEGMVCQEGGCVDPSGAADGGTPAPTPTPAPGGCAAAGGALLPLLALTGFTLRRGGFRLRRRR